MAKNVEIRPSGVNEGAAIEAIYPRAFPDEELRPLVRQLLDEASGVVSLVAVSDAVVVGHIMFTLCSVASSPCKIALLGPLAVDPGRQKQGIGSALVRCGFEHMKKDGANLVCVLGDPEYYGRFGFARESRVAPPYPLPQAWNDAWQSISFGTVSVSISGTLCVPEPWREETLWSQ